MSIIYRHGFFTHPNTERKANVILHELIHSVTMYAINDYRKGGKNLSPEMKEAVKTLYDVFGQIERDQSFSGEYGVKDVREMVAEMAQPRFREKLKAKNLWRKIVDAVKRLFGIKADGAEETTAYKEVSAALDTMLETFDEGLYQQYVGKKNTAFTGRTGHLSTNPSSGGLVQSATHSPTDTPGVPFDDAKVRRFSQSAKNNVKKYKNGDGYISKNSLANTYRDLRRFFAMNYSGRSNYVKGYLERGGMKRRPNQSIQL